MRILIPTPDFPPAHGGIQILIERLARYLDDHEVVVVTPSQPGDTDFDRELPYRVVRVSAPGGRRPALLRLNVELPRLAARLGAEAIISGHIICGLGSLLAGRRLRVPVLQYAYAMELASRSGVAKAVLSRADVTIAISKYSEGLAVRAGARPDRIALVLPGVDPPPPERPPATEPVILTIARMHNHYKGFDVMLRALPLVLARVPQARWVVLGDGRLRAGLEDSAERSGVASSISFLGAVSDADRDRWLSKARVFALPSRVPASGAGEGFGIVFLEAGRYGVPSVVADEGGGAEAVIDGVTGTHVDPRDHVALAGAIVELLQDVELQRVYGAAARRRAAELSWPAMARGVDSAVNAVQNGAG